MRKFNLYIVLIVIISVLLTGVINYIIDPFDIFRVFKKERINLNKTCLSKQERMTQIPALKMNKDKIEIICVGSSKVDWWFNPYYVSKISGKSVKSLAMSSSSLKESIIMVENALIIHPEIKKIYFGLDFFSFSSNYYDTAVDIEKINTVKITKQELLPVLFSFDTLKYSFTTVKDNILSEKPYNKYDVEPLKNPKALHYFEQTVKKYDRDYYSDYSLNTDAISALKEFQKFANERNAEVIFLFTPSHIIDLLNINEHSLTDVYGKLKILLAKNFDYYDLSSINEYNTEPISVDMKYFRDAVHATRYLGSFIEQSLFVKKNNSAILLTKDNVEKYVKDEEIKFNKYIEENPQTVNQIKEWIK